jgi:hypothetical protein
MTDTASTSGLAGMYDRLAARFVPPLGSMEVRRCIEDVATTFAAAPIQTYVAVLVERIATDRLRAVVESRKVVSVRRDLAIESGGLTTAAAAS